MPQCPQVVRNIIHLFFSYRCEPVLLVWKQLIDDRRIERPFFFCKNAAGTVICYNINAEMLPWPDPFL
ncbi:hypothetical protein ES703_76434 [subsurface metagenome]